MKRIAMMAMDETLMDLAFKIRDLIWKTQRRKYRPSFIADVLLIHSRSTSDAIKYGRIVVNQSALRGMFIGFLINADELN
jgi:hypothetical protein